MSVCEEKDRIEKLVNTIVSAYKYKGQLGGIEDCVIDYRDMREIRMLCKNDENEILKCVVSKIWWFGNRLYWANQQAMMITYSDIPRTLNEISESCAEGKLMPATWKELYNICSMIEYNCTSNGGTVTLSKQDEAALIEIKLLCASRVIRS